MKEEEIEDATFFFALGMERVCKGLLFDINPSFILETSKFAEIVTALYPDKIIDASAPEISNSKAPNYSKFKDLISRSAHFYQACAKNKDILNNLREYRNTLAHRPLRLFVHAEVHKWLIGVYYPVVSSILEEAKIEYVQALGSRAQLLENLSRNAKHEEEVARRVAATLSTFRSKWEKLNNQKYMQLSNAKTNIDLTQSRSTHDNSYDQYSCPACRNPAVLEVEPDFDFADGVGFLSGVYPLELRCHYCGLTVNDYEDLSYLVGDNWWEKIETSTPQI